MSGRIRKSPNKLTSSRGKMLMKTMMKPTSPSAARVKFSSDYITCLAILAHLRGSQGPETQKHKYTMRAISNVWYGQLEFARRVLAECAKPKEARDKEAPEWDTLSVVRTDLNDSMLGIHGGKAYTGKVPNSFKVLILWRAMRRNNLVCTKTATEKKTKKELQYEAGSSDFLYDLVLNNGSCNCSCGSSMLYELIKILAPEIDIRSVYGCTHTFIAVVDTTGTWLIETTSSTSKSRLFSVDEFKRLRWPTIDGVMTPFISPQSMPEGIVVYFQNLIASSLRLNSSVLFSDVVKWMKIYPHLLKSKNLQVQLFARLISGNDVPLALLKSVFDDRPFGGRSCAYYEMACNVYWIRNNMNTRILKDENEKFVDNLEYEVHAHRAQFHADKACACSAPTQRIAHERYLSDFIACLAMLTGKGSEVDIVFREMVECKNAKVEDMIKKVHYIQYYFPIFCKSALLYEMLMTCLGKQYDIRAVNDCYFDSVAVVEESGLHVHRPEPDKYYTQYPCAIWIGKSELVLRTHWNGNLMNLQNKLNQQELTRPLTVRFETFADVGEQLEDGIIKYESLSDFFSSIFHYAPFLWKQHLL